MQETQQEPVKVQIQKDEPINNNRSLKLLLIIGLCVVAISSALIYWDQRPKETALVEDLVADISGYQLTQSFDLDVPVVIDQDLYNTETVRGRVLDIVIENAQNYNEAILFAKQKAEQEIKEGEALFQTPINKEPKELSFPLKTEWLLFFEKEADDFLIRTIASMNKEGVDYALDSIEKISIKETDDVSILLLQSQVNVSLNTLIKITEPEPEIIEQDTVLIKETGTGWLRVRKGPGTDYAEITKVNVGDSFTLLEESFKWYKIKIGEEEGWIFSDYATLDK